MLRLALSVTASGEPALALQDERGTPRLGFALAEGGPGFRLYDSEGRRRVVLGLAPRGLVFDLADRSGTPRIGLQLTAEGIPAADLRDEKGRLRASLALTRDGSGVGGAEHPALRLYDSKERVRLELRVAGDEPRIVLTDERGQILVSHP
jgi:hypothetical protein